ncbi:MAG TPA: hypothetical protein VKF62_09640 [Planctomycetota bacterium]|nr:hypothetical protein [Planctomycetota bacterium]
MQVLGSSGCLSALLLGAIVSTAAIQASSADLTRALRAEVSAELRALRVSVKAGLDHYGHQFDGLGDAVTGGAIRLSSTVPAVVDFANGALVALQATADKAARIVEGFAADQVSTNPFFPGSILGDLGALDRFRAALQAETRRARARLEKRVLAFTRRVGADTGFLVHATLWDQVDVVPPAPNPGTAVPVPPRALKIFALAAGSDVSVGGDGILSVGGEAEPGTDPVTVTILGPAGYTDVHVVGVNPVTGRWGTTFPAGGTPNLPEGNYRVEATQGAGASINAGIGIQGAP